MVRLVFRPFAHVRRTICTSVSLRASTRVSSGFTLRTQSSPSFGSRPVCSDAGGTNTPRARGAAPTRFPRCSLSLRVRVSLTQTLAQQSYSLVRVSRRVVGKRFACVLREVTPGSSVARETCRGGYNIQVMDYLPPGTAPPTADTGQERWQRRAEGPHAQHPRTPPPNRSLLTISRTISLSFQSSFHLSLAVLVCYRSLAGI